MPPSPQYRAHKRSEQADRRRKLAELRCSGVHSQEELAAQLGCSVPTVQRDLALIEHDWQATTRRDLEADKALDLVRAEALLAGLWERATVGGDVRAVEVVMGLLHYRAKLLGLYAPKQQEQHGGAPLNLAELVLSARAAREDGQDGPRGLPVAPVLRPSRGAAW